MSESGPQDQNTEPAQRETPRRGLPKRPASQRAADFREVYGSFTEATARDQAKRCLQCSDPNCVQACPLCNPIPQWMRLTAEGRFHEAASVLGASTNMAEICARVCPSDRLCEGHCALDSVSDPVAIQGIEQFLIDYALANPTVDIPAAPPNGKKVAVAGSGPCGLACAEELAKLGYKVTVLDSSIIPGGLFADGVPSFRLDPLIVQRRIDLLRKRGIIFRLGVGLWDVLTLTDLRQDYDAVFLGFDSRVPRPLEIGGVHLEGVVQALPFLLQKASAISSTARPLDVTGKRVVVIGGGDTALDCLRAAIRYGAKEAIGLYRREQTDMPCNPREYENAVEEGASYKFRTDPIMILGNSNDVTGIRVLETHIGPTHPGQRRAYIPIPDTEYEISADWVVLALGFETLPTPRAGEFRKLTRNYAGGLKVDANLMTSQPGVFAGGDVAHEPRPLMETIRDGRNAAAAIHAYLNQPSQAKS
jgi:glutamate synthase (NADPH/NADH) small chain